MREADIKALGFKRIDQYSHDSFCTNLYKNGVIEIEFTYVGTIDKHDKHPLSVDVLIEQVAGRVFPGS